MPKAYPHGCDWDREQELDAIGLRERHEIGECNRYCQYCIDEMEDRMMAFHDKTHICHGPDYCICSVAAVEPNEYCPIHGGCLKTYPEKCVICGRFMKVRETMGE